VDLTELSLNAWIFLLVGLLLAFFGRALIILQINLLGALLGALGGSSLLALLLNGGLTVPPEVPLYWLQVGAMLIGALVGWVLASMLRRVAVFVLGALAGGAALSQVAAVAWPGALPDPLAWLIGAVVGGVLMLALEGPLLKLATAILGGLLVTSALTALLPPEQAGAASLAGLAAAVVGAGVQLARR
jgi:hypothetical protein